MSKLTKLLDSLGIVDAVNDSGSIYYLIHGRKIRVSDHIAPTLVMNEFEILTFENSKTNYIVSLYGILHIFHSFTELKQFILNWSTLSKAYDVRKARENSLNIIKGTKKVETLKEEVRRLNDEIKIANKEILFINDFTLPQIKAIKGFINSNNANKLLKSKK